MNNFEIRIVGEGHDPHEYEGLVFNMPTDQIPIQLAREVARVGSMELWQFQAFVHHEHPSMGQQDPLIEEPRLVDEWTDLLSTRFPHYQFVISVSPCDRMTWYQVTETSPTEDDAEFENYAPPISITKDDLKALFEKSGGDLQKLREAQREDFRRRTRRSGSTGACDHCGSEAGFTNPEAASNHRGVRIIKCLACRAELIHSTKTIRFVVGASVARDR